MATRTCFSQVSYKLISISSQVLSFRVSLVMMMMTMTFDSHLLIIIKSFPEEFLFSLSVDEHRFDSRILHPRSFSLVENNDWLKVDGKKTRPFL